MKIQLKADLLLVIVALTWGVSYYVMDICLTSIEPFMLNAIRFLTAFFVAGLLGIKKMKSVSRNTLKYSLFVGTALCMVYIGATFGVKYTTISNAGFLCGMTVVFVPILSFLFLRRIPEKKTVITVLASLVGIMLLTLKDDFSINTAHIKGDLFCILCSTAYATDLLLTEKAVSHKDVDAFQLGVFQLGVSGIWMTLFMVLFEDPQSVQLSQISAVWGYVAFLAVFSTGICYIAQTIAQKYTTASHVGIIFAMEPVFASLSAFFLAGEVLTVKSYIGALIILSALIATEIDFKKMRRERL